MTDDPSVTEDTTPEPERTQAERLADAILGAVEDGDIVRDGSPRSLSRGATGSPKPGSTLAPATAAFDERGIKWTLNTSKETSIRFVGPLDAKALAGEPPVAPPVAPDEESPQPGGDA